MVPQRGGLSLHRLLPAQQPGRQPGADREVGEDTRHLEAEVARGNHHHSPHLQGGGREGGGRQGRRQGGRGEGGRGEAGRREEGGLVHGGMHIQ